MRKTKSEAIDYQALADFRHEIRHFLNFSEQAARNAKIEPHQHQALLAIWGQAEGIRVTVGLLAERLQIVHHSAVELIDRLEKKGLIERLRGEKDRRQVTLRLTPRAKHLLRRLSVSHREELRLTGPRLVEALKRALSGKDPKRPARSPVAGKRASAEPRKPGRAAQKK
jgi:DNA-binding MarR family transcriptional regulator